MAPNLQPIQPVRQHLGPVEVQAATFKALRDLVAVGGPGPVFVQVKLLETSWCARLVEALPARGRRPDMVRVDLVADGLPWVGALVVSAYRARLCSGTDGRCVCAAAGRATAPAGGGPAGAAPLGNTGITE